MAMRSIAARCGLGRLMDSNRRLGSSSGFRYFSDKGRVLSEEERARENVFVQKHEREMLEKQRVKAEKEKAEREKAEKKTDEETPKS